MVKLGILSKSGTHPRNIAYQWKRRKPYSAMIIKVVDTLNSYSNKKHAVKAFTKHETTISKKVAHLNLDEFLDIYEKLPANKLSRNERKNLAKELVELKHK
jgi:hypothetical protein